MYSGMYVKVDQMSHQSLVVILSWFMFLLMDITIKTGWTTLFDKHSTDSHILS